jgi:3-methyladenine DNA glycosylase AlkD
VAAEFPAEAVAMVQSALADAADPEKAAGMQAYMKTDMPFYGVQKPERARILRRLCKEHPPADHGQYLSLATALWELPHREEKYLAQGVATAFPKWIIPESFPLYERFVVEGAWWDFVDETATHMIRTLVLGHPGYTWPIMDHWIDDPDMWRRRSALLCQIGAGSRTDQERLFDYCRRCAHETEFFIRKAIGWALRDYGRTAPEEVAHFATTHRDELSGLSYREATKHLGHLVN